MISIPYILPLEVSSSNQCSEVSVRCILFNFSFFVCFMHQVILGWRDHCMQLEMSTWWFLHCFGWVLLVNAINPWYFVSAFVKRNFICMHFWLLSTFRIWFKSTFNYHFDVYNNCDVSVLTCIIVRKSVICM